MRLIDEDDRKKITETIEKAEQESEKTRQYIIGTLSLSHSHTHTLNTLNTDTKNTTKLSVKT
jgi:hypothetical protein